MSVALQSSETAATRYLSRGRLLLAGVLPFLAVAYSAGLLFDPLLGRSALAVLCLSSLFFISLGMVFLHPSRDLIDPLRLVSLAWLLVYCIAPFFTDSWTWAFRGNPSDLAGSASAMALVAYLMIALGYHLGGRLSQDASPVSSSGSSSARAPLLIIFSLVIFGVGLLSYGVLLAASGGVDRLIGGNENRVEFFKGSGIFFFGSMFMYSGAALYFAAQASRERRFSVLSFWPLLVIVVLFLPLQGRSRVIQALVILATIFHYRIRRIPIRLAVTAVPVVFALFIFVGHARDPSIRPLLLTHPLTVVRDAIDNAPELVTFAIGQTLNRLPQTMIVLENFPEHYPYRWGSTLLVTLNPLFRQIGLEHLQTENLGTRIQQLARPWQPEWLESGFHPSLLGELLVNFPWYLTFLPLIGYGLLLRRMYKHLIHDSRDPVRLALYAAVIFRMIYMVIVGVGQLLFEMLVIAVPILITLAMPTRSSALHATTPQRVEERATR